MAKILNNNAEVNELPLNYINYDSIRSTSTEFLGTDTWEFNITRPAAAVYFPGNNFLHTRLQQVSVNMEDGNIGQMQTTIRGFKVHSPVGNSDGSGTVTLTMHEMVDQSLLLWLWDWCTKISNPDNKFSYASADTLCDAEVIVYDSQRRPIRKYICLRGYPSNPSDIINFSGTSEDRSDAGDGMSVTLNFERVMMEILNV